MKYCLFLLLALWATASRAQTPAATLDPAAALAGQSSTAQRYSTGTGQITFFSTAPLEDIEALNSKVGAIFEMGTGKLAFSLQMRDFQFKNSLMQEHFNENYAESDKYPRARFTGKLLSLPTSFQLQSGPQPVTVQGFLTIHNVRRKVQVPGTIQLRGNDLVVTSKLSVKPADYKIKIPALVRDNIAKIIDINIILSCQPAPEATVSR